jgi:hypothetical protein
MAAQLSPAVAAWVDAQSHLVDCGALRTAFVEHAISAEALPAVRST